MRLRIVVAALASSVALGPAAAVAQAPTPQLISVRYGKFRQWLPRSGHWAVRVRAQDPDGSIVSVQVTPVNPPGPIVHMDGGCLTDRRDGRATNWFAGMRLRPGRHRVRITLTSASCEDINVPLEERTFLRTLRVR